MIVAELCQNHQGKTSIMCEMLNEIHRAGCRHAKIQTYFADDLSDEYLVDRHRMKGLELDWNDHEIFVKRCKELAITPITSVYTFNYAQQLWDLGFRYIKIGSAQATDEVLIRKYLTAGFKLFLSTGGHEIADLPYINPLYCVMHCVSQYPASPHEADLLRLLDLRKRFPHARLGFSDHTDPLDIRWDIPVKVGSIFGASYIEKHFTILGRNETKDGKVSIDRGQLKELVRFDKLSFEDKLKERPELGLFRFNKTNDEKKLIKTYSRRWNPPLSNPQK